MLKRIAPIRVISFLLLAACGALCQIPFPDSPQGDGSNPREAERLGMLVWTSLPDAPSVQHPRQAENFQMFVRGAHSHATLRGIGINGGAFREIELGRFVPRLQPAFTASYTLTFPQKESSNLFGKYLYPSLLNRTLRYRRSSSIGFVGRAADAASRIFIVRDDSGKRRLNTPYFLGMLTSVAVHTAHRPYWARSTSATFSNFGSTIGNDAGASLLQEFEPGIRQMLKGHAPQFVSRMEERIVGNQNLSEVVSNPTH